MIGMKKCTECRKEIKQATRVYKEHIFCSTCYYREFKHRNCPKCGKERRLPRFNKNAICKPCESKTPCIRCGKTKFKAGLITPYGRACSNCARYFQKIEQCSKCDKPSRHLSRTRYLPEYEKVCPKCLCQAKPRCESCRERRVTYKNENSQMVCKACLSGEMKRCSSCQELMPLGRSGRCRSCSWKKTYERRISLLSKGIKSKDIQTIFLQYSKWLAIHAGQSQAATKIKNDFSFFTYLDKAWGYIPTYEALLLDVTPEGLRGNRRLVNWLNDQGCIQISQSLKQGESERLQVAKVIKSLDKKDSCYELITSYHKYLSTKFENNKISLRTLRLALSSAIDLVKIEPKNGSRFPSQKSVDNFIVLKPGQIANITGFVNYINCTFDQAIFVVSAVIFLKNKSLSHIPQKSLKYRLELMIEKYYTEPEKLNYSHLNLWSILSVMHHYNESYIAAKKIISSIEPSINDLPLEFFYYEKPYWIPSPHSTKMENNN